MTGMGQHLPPSDASRTGSSAPISAIRAIFHPTAGSDPERTTTRPATLQLHVRRPKGTVSAVVRILFKSPLARAEPRTT